MALPPESVYPRLESERNIWMATIRPESAAHQSVRPHLVPVWFIWVDLELYVCISPTSVKGRNVQQNPHVSLSLEDGSHVVICEGRVEVVEQPWAVSIIETFQEKYDWNIVTDADYGYLLRIVPQKWLIW